MTVIRPAVSADVGRLLEIYAHYVAHTAITFAYAPPTLPEFQARMARVMERYPYLVAERDGAVAGYAHAHAFVGRAAYDWSCELTVYLDHTARGCGLGRQLYTALEDRLRALGFLNLYACIAYPDPPDEYLTRNSAEFHAHMGFTKVGEFHRCGYKFGRWYSMIWMEKLLGPHRPGQAPQRRDPSQPPASL